MKNVTDIFKVRFRELRIMSKKSQEELAHELGVSRGAISYYEKGDRVPDINVLNSIADYFHVSCDYLLGRSDIPKPDIERQAISELTGLSDTSISALKLLKKTSNPECGLGYETATHRLLMLEAINVIIESHADDLLSNLCYYFFTNFTHFGNFYAEGETPDPISELALYDNNLRISYSEDYDFFSNAFLLMIQRDLTDIRNEYYRELSLALHPVENRLTAEETYKVIREFLKTKSKQKNPFES